MDVKDTQKINPAQYPVLPLRDIVVFPGMVVPLFVGREKSINALNSVMDKYKKIILAAQKSHDVDDPKDNEIYQVGCLGEILQLLKLPDGTVKILVEGKERVKINQYNNEEKNYLLASCSKLTDDLGKEDLSLLSKAVLNKFDKLVKLFCGLTVSALTSTIVLKPLFKPVAAVTARPSFHESKKIAQGNRMMPTNTPIRLEPMRLNQPVVVVSVRLLLRSAMMSCF